MDLVDEVQRIGQHIWLDDLSTTALDDGSIARRRDECGVSGITANPTIFDQAISSGAYDERIGRLDDSPTDVFWNLAVEDIGRAADLLVDIHRRTNGRTGWVSIELDPRLAHDAARSIEQGRAIHERIGRPNVMIKVPGTPEGATAIEELVYLGVPVNVTLLFGMQQWRAAEDAYGRGLERRRTAERSMLVGSVASFFLSRIDRRLDPELPAELQHLAGLTCAALVREAWVRSLAGARWSRLLEGGALSQQLLWASTSPKADDLDELYYATRLAAPDTVITLPGDTLDELCGASGQVHSLDELDPAATRRQAARIEDAAGIGLDEVADELQHDGLARFGESFEGLLVTIHRVQSDMAAR